MHLVILFDKQVFIHTLQNNLEQFKRTASQLAEADCRPQPRTGEVSIDKLEGHTSSGSVMFSKVTLVHPVPLHDPGDIASKIWLSVIGRAKQAPHWGVQSRFHVMYIMCVCRGPKRVGGITWAKHAHAQSQYWEVKSDQ